MLKLMRYLLSAIFGAIAYCLFPNSILYLPLSQLTTGELWKLTGAIGFCILALSPWLSRSK